jgi:hypothetical protein
MLTPKKPHPLAKYVAGQVTRHQQAARTDTAIDQAPYVGNAYEAGKKAAGFKRGGQWSFADGGELDRFPDGGQTNKKGRPRPEDYRGLNLNDFVYDGDEISHLNSLSEYCPDGTMNGCLGAAFKAYDKTVAYKWPSAEFPTSARLKEQMGVQSVGDRTNPDGTVTSAWEQYEAMSPQAQASLRSVEYMNPESGDFTMDSWDFHELLRRNGGTNLYVDKEGGRFESMTPEERKALYKTIPVGSFLGYGGGRDGLNARNGLVGNNHSAVVVGFDTDGTPIVYDYTRYGRIDDPKYDFGMNMISYPKEAAGNTWEGLEKRGILNGGKPEDLELDTSRLEGADRGELDRFVDSLAHNKPALMNQLNLSNSEYDELAKALTGISMQETKGGANWKYNLEGIAQSVGINIGDTHGMTQLNFDNIKENPALYKIAKEHGITSARDLRKPWNAAVASMIYAKSNKFMSQQNLQDGQAPGERVFRDPGVSLRDFIPGEELGSFSSDGFYVEESNDRVPVLGTSVLGIGSYREPEEIQQDLDRKAPGIYRVRQNEEGAMEIVKKTKGNAAGQGVNGAPIDDLGAFVYSWQSPNAVKTGDALGASKYYRNVLEAMAKMTPGKK